VWDDEPNESDEPRHTNHSTYDKRAREKRTPLEGSDINTKMARRFVTKSQQVEPTAVEDEHDRADRNVESDTCYLKGRLDVQKADEPK
jgi:hypothetical protein